MTFLRRSNGEDWRLEEVRTILMEVVVVVQMMMVEEVVVVQMMMVEEVIEMILQSHETA